MKHLRLLSFLLILTAAFSLGSCYQPEDDNLPEPKGTASYKALMGKWVVYEVAGGNFGEDLVSYKELAYVDFKSGNEMEILRRGVLYNGTYHLSPDGQYMQITVDNPTTVVVEYPGNWSIQRADKELWLATGAKFMKLRREFASTK